MKQKTVFISVLAVLAAFVAGWSVGGLTARTGLEEAMTRRKLVPRSELEDLSARYKTARAELERVRAEKEKLRAERRKLAAELNALKKKRSMAAAEARALKGVGGSMPVAFGKYAELEALKKADWHDMADAVSRMNALLLDVIDREKKGLPPPPNFRSAIMKENNRLLQLAGGIMGKIPTHRMGNGEFTHPLVLSNIMAAMLDNAEFPLTEEQRSEIARIGNEFDGEYERLQKEYTEDTPELAKFIDELELKREVMDRIFELLSPEQYRIVAPDALHGRMPVDCLSPALMAIMLARNKDMTSRESLRQTMHESFARMFELSEPQMEAAADAFEAYWRLVEPTLKPTSPEEPVTIDTLVATGRAQAELLRALLELPDLNERNRAAILGDTTWFVPRLIKAAQSDGDEAK